jgi:Mrp family chromosome partitioning ATPase
VVVELPPVRVASEALALAGLCDACALVVRQSSTSRTEVRAAIDHLGQERLLGVILNQTSSKVPTPLLRAVAQS